LDLWFPLQHHLLGVVLGWRMAHLRNK